MIVGVSSDELNKKKKDRYPVYSQEDRLHIVESLRCVDAVFIEESLELKGHYIEMFNADMLVMGDDWAGKFDHFSDICDVHYFERTPSISTSEIIEVVRTGKYKDR